MQTPEYKTVYELGYDIKTGQWTLTGLMRLEDYNAEWRAYWAWLAKRRFHALPEEKGIPVPHTGRSRWHSRKDNGKSGVIGGSRVLPHRYADEGDKGASHNRHVKRLERALWRSEALTELEGPEDGYSVSEWFTGSPEQD